ncbi:MAG: hypothetical protein WCL30_02450 [Pseudomonadota bacterium]
MKYRTISVLALILLSACADMRNNSVHTLDIVEDKTADSWTKIRGYMGLSKKKSQVKSDPRYCYRTYNDIMCYDTPLQGEESRLVAYQGEGGKTGYIITGNEQYYSQNLAPLQSVNVGAAPKILGSSSPNTVKKKDNSKLKELIFDPAELQPKGLVSAKEK